MSKYFPVRNGEEYIVSGEYESSTKLNAEIRFIKDDGSTKYVELLNVSTTTSSISFTEKIEIPSGVKSMAIDFFVKGKEVNFKVSNPKIEKLKGFDKGMVTLVFDDGYKTYIDNAIPLLEKYNVKSTAAIISGSIGDSRYMDLNDLFKIKKLGHEIAAHTRHHLRFSQIAIADNLINEIVGVWYDLKVLGIDTKTFVIPYGDYTPGTLKIASNKYIATRSVIRGYNTKNSQIDLLKDQLIEASTTNEEMDSYLKEAMDGRKWVILELHDVFKKPDTKNPDSITEKQLEILLQKIKNSGLDVVTLEQGANIMLSK